MTNHEKRLQRILAALKAQGIATSFCNELPLHFGADSTKTTISVPTASGQLTIKIGLPGLNRPPFRVNLDQEFAGFNAEIAMSQTDLLALIRSLDPPEMAIDGSGRGTNVTDIRKPLL